jgi:hypothetical protein
MQRMRENDLIIKSATGEHTSIDEHWSQTESQQKENEGNKDRTEGF